MFKKIFVRYSNFTPSVVDPAWYESLGITNESTIEEIKAIFLNDWLKSKPKSPASLTDLLDWWVKRPDYVSVHYNDRDTEQLYFNLNGADFLFAEVTNEH